MTVDELKAAKATDLSQTAWIREMCIQLATLTEHLTRKPGRPPQKAR